MTNEEKAVGIGLHVRDFSISKGVTKDNAEIVSLIAQQSAMKMAEWKDEILKCCANCYYFINAVNYDFACEAFNIWQSCEHWKSKI